nr:MAG TPA: hypothetical protein [Caudoviricetes sp.]
MGGILCGPRLGLTQAPSSPPPEKFLKKAKKCLTYRPMSGIM